MPIRWGVCPVKIRVDKTIKHSPFPLIQLAGDHESFSLSEFPSLILLAE